MTEQLDTWNKEKFKHPDPWNFDEIAQLIFEFVEIHIGKETAIFEDLARWKSILCKDKDSDSAAFSEIFKSRQEFRSVIAYRFDKLGFGHVYNEITRVPGWFHVSNLYLSCQQIGGGIYVEHGYSTIVFAKSIGKNFWVNQNVTVGSNKTGNPTIGDDVSIRTGAVVIGGIKIGNRVKIGANAFVDFDIPDDSIVVAPRVALISANTRSKPL